MDKAAAAADVKIKQRVRKDRRKMHYENDWPRGDDKWQGFRNGKGRDRQDGEEAVSGLSSMSIVRGPPVIRRMSLIVLGSCLRCVLETTITSSGRLVLKVDIH